MADPVSPERALRAAVDGVLTHLVDWRPSDAGVLVVALDGHGASGKTTIARRVAAALTVALVHTDDFFRDECPPAAADPRPLAGYYDWAALRAQALEPLRAGRPGGFPHRHWEQPELAGRWVVVDPHPIVLLDGVTAAGPALADLVDRRVLVATPEPERLRRLHERIPDAEWDADWLAAEQAYFDSLDPDGFDLTVAGTAEPTLAESGSA